MSSWTLVLVGVLITCYRTSERIDNIVAVVAGLAAIGIGLFPMSPVYAAELLSEHPEMNSVKCYIPKGILGYHFIFVAAFFALCFYMVTFRFTAVTQQPVTHQKIRRNRVYRICGVVMLCCFVAIGILAVMKNGGSIFRPETGAVIAFGVAWLVKGQTILKDRPGEQGVGA